jgi:hypothetical protein
MLRSTPHHSNYGGGFALRWVFVRCKTIFLSNLPFWSDDVIMTSPALLNDALRTSFKLVAILVGVAFIRLGGVSPYCLGIFDGIIKKNMPRKMFFLSSCSSFVLYVRTLYLGALQ